MSLGFDDEIKVELKPSAHPLAWDATGPCVPPKVDYCPNIPLPDLREIMDRSDGRKHP
jgi:hypothetical protein